MNGDPSITSSPEGDHPITIQQGLRHGATGSAVAELHVVLSVLGVEVEEAERQLCEFGESTAAAVREVQRLGGLEATGELNEETVALFVEVSARRGQDDDEDGDHDHGENHDDDRHRHRHHGQPAPQPGRPRIVSGKVTDADGGPKPDVTVVALDCDIRSQNELGSARTNAAGAYSIEYSASALLPDSRAADLQIQILDSAGTLLFTSPILFNAPLAATIDAPLGGAKRTAPSELSALIELVTPLIGRLEPTELMENVQFQDLSFLSGETAIPKVRLAYWTIAARLATKTELPAELFYALLRGGVPLDAATVALATTADGVDLEGNAGRLEAAILATSSTARTTAVEASVAANIVRASYQAEANQDLEQLAALAGTATLTSNTGFGKSSLGAVLQKVGVVEPIQQKFATLYKAARGANRRGFWKQLENDPTFTPDHVAALRFGVTVGRLTRGHLPLIQELAAQRAAGLIKGAPDLARLTADEWKQLLAKQVNGAPIATPPEFTAAAAAGPSSVDRYAAQLETSFTAVYPTTAFSARVARDARSPFQAAGAVADYLDSNPAIDLRRINLDVQARAKPISDQVRRSLLAAQRLMKLNASYPVMRALMADGIHSAHQVYALGRDNFVANYGSLPQLGAEGAHRTFSIAEQTYAMALATTLRLNRQFAGVIPAATNDGLAPDDVAKLDGYPTLATLFGQDSWCSCKDCESVLGAPAYLVDILEFLNKRSPVPGQAVQAVGKSVRDVLLARRPDIANLELSCPNTNTALPYIDLVNELLEDAVAPPPNPINRQTKLSTPELDANPDKDCVNAAAYDVVARAVYPWTLPFDLPLAEARTYLRQLGLDRPSLMRRFQKPDGYPVNSPQARAIAIEILGMRPLEADIITAGPLAAGKQPWEWWGLGKTDTVYNPANPDQSASGSWWSLLSNVWVLLDRAGLTYTELTRLLNTVFINGANQISIIPGGDDTCDISKMTIKWVPGDGTPANGGGSEGQAMQALERIHRFVRLWRRLGWDVYDLDDAIAVLQNAAPAGVSRLNDQLLRQAAAVLMLARRYSLATPQAVAMFVTTPTFASIPTRNVQPVPGDMVRYSLYHDLFQNLTVLNPTDPIFELNAAGTEIAQLALSPMLANHSPTLVAALQVSATDLRYAISTFTPDGKLTLANLSALYRNVTLATSLGITLRQLSKLVAIAETGTTGAPGYEQVEPFDGHRPESIFALAALLDVISASTLSIEQVDYIVRDVYETDAGVAPDPVAVGTLLLALRTALLKIDAETAPTADPTGVAVRKQLTALLDKDKVDELMGILDGTGTPPAKPDPATFVANTLGGYMDAAAAQNALVSPGTVAAGQPRFEYVLDRLLANLRRSRSTNLIVQTLAQSLSVPTAVCALLVKEWFPAVSAASGHLIDDLLLLPTLSPPNDDEVDPIPKDAPAFQPYFDSYAVLAKTALIISTLKLARDDVDWWHGTGVALGWLDPTTLPTTATASAQGRLRQLARMFAAAPLRHRIGPAIGSFKDLFDIAGASVTKTKYLTTLESLTQWPADSLDALCGDPTTVSTGLLALTYPDDYRSEVALARIAPAIDTITRTGIPPAIGTWIASILTADVADAIKQAVKSKYSSDQWLTLAKQLRDPLREQQRDALVAYLLAGARPADATRWFDANDVFGHLLIDVEMSACMETSRIVQANAAVQLFVQRCILGVERDVQVDYNLDADWTQWQWMAQYRVWQANREVFLFPENWLDPTLRSTKSQFFTELEKDLKQGDINPDNVESALQRYLEKLEAVARLDVCGTFHDTEIDHGQAQDVLHVIARTQGHPPVYYHRKWVNSAIWTPWEKVDLDINSNHLLPVVWNGKHYLFWALCTVKQDQNNNPPITVPKAGNTFSAPGPAMHLEVQLAWSQYKQGKWQPKQVAPQTLAFSDAADSPDITLKSVVADSNVLQINVFLAMDPGDRLHSGAFRLGGAGTGVEAFVADPSSLAAIGGSGVAEVGQLPSPYSSDALAPSNSDFDGDWFAPAFLQPSQTSSAARPRISPVTASYSLYGTLTTETLLNTADYFRLIVPHQTPSFDSSMPFFYRDPAREYFVIPSVYSRPGYYVEVTGRYGSEYWYPLYGTDYAFHTFYHPFVGLLVKQLNWGGIDALYKRELQLDPATFAGKTPFSFSDYYSPTDVVMTPYPSEGIDFEPEAGYALYNWELFYHAPVLIGKLLAANQRFDLARHWYEYVFNPAGSATDLSGSPANGPQRYWIAKPLFEGQANDFMKQQLAKLMSGINQHDAQLERDVLNWRADPFDPDAIAQWRNVAYARAIVMKYIDNLIGWGDQLFTQDTRETINLATQLYVLAYQLLGPRPELISPREQPTPQTYEQLVAAGLDDFSNALVAAENVIPPVAVDGATPPGAAKLPNLHMLYFRIPPNSQLLSYWDTVEDRLFKIRHCMNIQGVVQQLSLFAPPISPALLIAAQAAGLDLASVLSDSNAVLPPYRFRTMLRHAIELCEIVRGLGLELLAALEKSDAEQLARIRSGAEKDVQTAIADVRQREIDAANQAIDVLAKSRQAFVDRANFYVKRPRMNALEEASLFAQGGALLSETAAGIVELAAATGHIVPDFTAGAQGIASPTAVVKFGGDNIGHAAHTAAGVLRIAAAALQHGSQMMGTLGSYQQRKDSWDMEGAVAQDEIARIDSETLAAQIRLDIAQRQKAIQDRTVQEAGDVDDFLHSKFTDQELYDWMVSETSTTFFQAYQLAYSTAKQAEQCYQRELAIDNSSFIQFGYWDSLRKGLTSGDKLSYDLRRLESSYFVQNVRELEITKHVSLLQLDPYALVELLDSGSCLIQLPEILFDLDNPGHYMRRLKHVALTIPCVVGPYGGVSVTLTLLSSQIRSSADTNAAALQAGPGGPTQIVTSSAQNDAGYDATPDDDRYQPFYGCGAISTWRVSLNNPVPQFDYKTITDVVLHLRYTARDGGDAFRQTVSGNVKQQLNKIALAENRKGLYRLISPRHEYSTEWARFLNPPSGSDQVLSIATPPERFPFITSGMDIKAVGLDAIAKTSDGGNYTLIVTPPGGPPLTMQLNPDSTLGGANHVELPPLSPKIDLGRAPSAAGGAPPAWTFKLKQASALDYRSLTQAVLDDLVLIIAYEVS